MNFDIFIYDSFNIIAVKLEDENPISRWYDNLKTDKGPMVAYGT